MKLLMVILALVRQYTLNSTRITMLIALYFRCMTQGTAELPWVPRRSPRMYVLPKSTHFMDIIAFSELLDDERYIQLFKMSK